MNNGINIKTKITVKLLSVTMIGATLAQYLSRISFLATNNVQGWKKCFNVLYLIEYGYNIIPFCSYETFKNSLTCIISSSLFDKCTRSTCLYNENFIHCNAFTLKITLTSIQVEWKFHWLHFKCGLGVFYEVLLYF